MLTRQGLYCNIIMGGAADATSTPLEDCRVPNDLNSPSQCSYHWRALITQNPALTSSHLLSYALAGFETLDLPFERNHRAYQ